VIKKKCIPIFNYNRLLRQIPRGVPHKLRGSAWRNEREALPVFKKVATFQNFVLICNFQKILFSRSRWPRDLRSTCAVARLQELRVRIPPGALMSLCCECCEVEVSATS